MGDCHGQFWKQKIWVINIFETLPQLVALDYWGPQYVDKDIVVGPDLKDIMRMAHAEKEIMHRMFITIFPTSLCIISPCEIDTYFLLLNLGTTDTNVIYMRLLEHSNI